MLDKHAVLGYLRERAERPVRLKELAQALGAEAEEYRQLKRLLRELEERGEIYRVRGRRYALPSRINLIVGRLQVTHAGAGFVIPDTGDGDVFIPASQLGNAYDGDRVVARIERQRRGRNREGTVVRVLERARHHVVGVFQRSGRYGLLVPSHGTLHRDVFVPGGGERGAEDGELVVARIVDWGSEHHDPIGEVVEVLGRPGEPGVDVLAIIHNHELPTVFPSDVTSEADALAHAASIETAVAGRLDLRELLSFSIDPVDAKDHDDAISIEQLAHGRWRVGVHIADVSHFVQDGSAIDQEAFQRGTSVYLVDRVLPMLPDVLSGELCSLKAGQDRLTLSAILELDASGATGPLQLASSVIRSRYALSYESAQEIIDGTRSAERDLCAALKSLRDLAKQLRRRRRARGGLDFDLPEVRVIVNAAGEPTHVQQLLRLDTHQLIEEFMIAVNEAVARRAAREELPFIYRVHEAPDPDRLERLREFLSGLGLDLPKNAHNSPRALQRLLGAVEGQPEEAIVSTLVLRSMKQARYSAVRSGHFGLASQAYTHFTSPIRRYPDLLVHRIVRAAFCEQRPVAEALGEQLQVAAAHASLRERQAMEAERDSVELKKLEFMERHLGDQFSGTVSGVASYGLFVLLDNVLAEGLVHVSELEDDYYHYLEDEHALVGEARRRRIRLGDRVSVQIVAVDREARKLDLRLIERAQLSN